MDAETAALFPDSFEDSELGMIPRGWGAAQMDEIATVKGGKRLPKGFLVQSETTNHPYIRVKDITPSGINLTGLNYITPEVHQKISRYLNTMFDCFCRVIRVNCK
jgi:type I restriction enzyme S subunit